MPRYNARRNTHHCPCRVLGLFLYQPHRLFQRPAAGLTANARDFGIVRAKAALDFRPPLLSGKQPKTPSAVGDRRFAVSGSGDTAAANQLRGEWRGKRIMPASEKQISEEQVLVVSGNDILNLDLPTVTEAAGRRRLFEESSDVPSDRVKLVYHPSDA